MERLQEQTTTIKAQIEEYEAQILKIGGSRLLAQKSLVDGIRTHINIANDELTKAEVAKAKAEKDLAKYESSILNNQATLDEANAELEKFSNDIKTVTEEIEDIRGNVEQAREAAENSKEDLDNLKAELEEKSEGILAFRKREVGVCHSDKYFLLN